jgi:hypothetical protein
MYMIYMVYMMYMVYMVYMMYMVYMLLKEMGVMVGEDASTLVGACMRESGETVRMMVMATLTMYPYCTAPWDTVCI